MEQYEPKETEFIESLKSLVIEVMFNSEIIPENLKRQIRKEIDNMAVHEWSSVWDEFETKEKLMETAVSFSITQWVNQNLKLSSLWKSIAIANASHGDNPSEVANNTLTEFKKEFTIDTKK